jgi:hypothetical protein
VREEDTSVLRKDDEKRRIRERISTLLGLPVVPEKRLRVQGVEINSASQNPVEEDEEWILGKPPAGDASVVVAFPRFSNKSNISMSDDCFIDGWFHLNGILQ